VIDPAASKRREAPTHQGLKFWLSAWIPVAIGIGIIVLESTELFGSNRTSHPLRWLWEALFGPVANARWDVVHHFIRKCGHFFGYGALGVAWLRAWWMSLPRSRFYEDASLALLGTFLVASLDEWHQSYLPNRTGSIWDVLLDCSGSIALILAINTYMRMMMPKRLRRAT
jgi:VanZ family protein